MVRFGPDAAEGLKLRHGSGPGGLVDLRMPKRGGGWPVAGYEKSPRSASAGLVSRNEFVRTTNRCPLGERPPPAQRRRRAARLVVRTEDHGVVRDVVFVWGGAGFSWGPCGASPSGAHVFHSIHGFRRLSNPGRKKSCGERMTGLEKKRFRGTPVGEAEEGVKKKVVGFPFGGGSKEGERKLFGGVEERYLRLNVRQCGEG